MTRVLLPLTAALLFAASPAAAQRAPGQTGPMVLQPIENPVVFAPDVKVTNIAGTTGVLLGGYGGINMDRTFLIGGAGYWVIDPLDTIHMGYGGLLLGWRLADGGAFSVSARGLIGFGSATMWMPYAWYPMPVGGRHRDPYYGPWASYWTNFLVAEPEVRAQFALGRTVAIDAGVGYRVTSSGWGGTDLLNGATGSIGLRFSFAH